VKENTMKIKTSELTGAALEWAVAKCEGFTDEVERSGWAWHPSWYNPATSWQEGGPIIEREEIFLAKSVLGGWTASTYIHANGCHCILHEGPTPLTAAMRCFVASKLGEEVDVPDELIV
jgi:hypothetical protein